MNYEFEYSSETERNQIITNNSDKFLVAEKNLVTGNYLVFSDVSPIEEQVKQLQQDNLITFEVLATIYEELLMKG